MGAYHRVAGLMMLAVGALAFMRGAAALVGSRFGFSALRAGGPMGFWSGLVTVGFAAGALMLGVGFFRRGRALAKAGIDLPEPVSQQQDAEERLPPVPVPPEGALDAVPEPVHACPRCGFLGIRAAGIGDGVWPGGGELIYRVCGRCGFRGQPLRFEERADYRAFLEDLQADDSERTPA